MKRYLDTEAVIKKLRRVEGHVRGIIKMVEDGKNCEELLVQISSARSSLTKTGQFILEEHLSHWVVDGIRKGRATDTIRKLSASLEQFSRLV